MRLKTAKKKAKQSKSSGGGNYLEWKDDGQIDIWIGCNDPDNQVGVRHAHFIPYENDDGESKKHKIICDGNCNLDKFLAWLKSEKDIDEEDEVWDVCDDVFTKADLLKWEGGDWKKAMWPKSETLFSVVVEDDGEFENKILVAGAGLFESITDVIEEYESENDVDFFEDPCCIRLIYKEKAAPAKKYRAKEMSKTEMPEEVEEIINSGEMLVPDDFIEHSDDEETAEHILANLVDGIDWEPDQQKEDNPKKKKKKRTEKSSKDETPAKSKKRSGKSDSSDEDDAPKRKRKTKKSSDEDESPRRKRKKKPVKKRAVEKEEEEEKPKRSEKKKPVKARGGKSKKHSKKDDDVTIACPSCDKETSLDDDDCEHCGEPIVGF